MSSSIQALGTVFGVCQSRYCPGAARAPSVSGGSGGAGGAGLGLAGGQLSPGGYRRLSCSPAGTCGAPSAACCRPPAPGSSCRASL